MGNQRLQKINTLILFCILSLMLILFEVGPGRSLVMTLTQPLRTLVSAPHEEGIAPADAQLRAANDKLQQEVEALRNEQTANEGREALTVGVSTYGASPYRNALIIEAGEADGVQEGDSVTAQGFFIGEVVLTTERTSTVVLVNDQTFRGIGETTSQTQGLLSGEYNAVLLQEIPQDAPLEEGEMVFTSKLDAHLEPGLPVGTVQAIYEDGSLLKYAQLASPVDFTTIEAVSVVR